MIDGFRNAFLRGGCTLSLVLALATACADDGALGADERTQTVGADDELASYVVDGQVEMAEWRPSPEAWATVSAGWLDRMLATHAEGTWAPMRFEPNDEELGALGLPSREVLRSQRYPVPTAVYPDGSMVALAATPVAAFAGTGCFGIRPGAWLLLLEGGVGWCSMAHVYGTPGNYAISTAGHCGRTGDRATVIGAVGDVPVLLDFGEFGTSHDGGLGNDWALIKVYPEYQHLVTPTMCFWGGPRGMFTKEGQAVGVRIPRKGFVPEVTINPDPMLAQDLLHYGHGLGMGAGGTPRSGTAIAWLPNHYMFFGAIAPGDSGSGANTLLGDNVGDHREAAGIMTHLWIDPLMRSGVGIMGGTRATVVTGTLANGQLVPVPAPVPIVP